MDEVGILKKTLGKQSGRIASLTLDLDLAHSQIEMLQEELNKLKQPEEPKAE